MSRCRHADTNVPKRDRPVLGLGNVPYRVPSPYILGDPTAHRSHTRRVCREVGLAAGNLGEFSKDAWVTIGVIGIVQTDSVNSDDASLDHFEHFPAFVLAGVVAPITDHDERFFIASPQLQLLQAGYDRVVQSRLSLRNGTT